MAYLSSVLGRHRDIQMTPMTDQEINLQEFQSVALQPSEIRLHEIRINVLENILPVPKESISASEIADFKEHGDLISVFRRNIEKSIINIAKTEDDYLREREVSIYKDELDEDIHKISKLMKKRNWGRIVIGFVKAVSVGIPIGTLLSHGISGPEYLKIPSLVLAVYNAYKGSPNEQEAILKTPLAYSAFARERFGG